jgi:hypothetical protein
MNAATLPAVASTTAGDIAYEAELEIAPTRIHDVEAWLPGHMAELLQLPGFVGVESFKAGTTPDGWIRRKNVYRLTNQSALDTYLRDIAPQMTARLRASFGDDVRVTRRVLEPAPLAPSLATALIGRTRGRTCRNCNAPLASDYCHECGQRDDPHIHSLWHFMREATENLTHADSRLWRTLWALLAKPGHLTHDFFQGRRARYLPPFRLYLVISLGFFLLLASFASDNIVNFDDGSPVELESAAAQLERNAAGGTADPTDIGASIQKGVAADLRETAEERRTAIGEKAVADIPLTPEQRAERACNDIKAAGLGSDIAARFQAGCRRAYLDDGKALRAEFMRNLPRAMFILLPLLALLMKLLYWRPKRYYVEHLLFFIHAHAAIFVVLGITTVLNVIPALDPVIGFLDFAVVLYVLWYLYKAMRRTYGQGRALTIGKYCVVGLGYITLAGIVTVFALVYSVAAA